VSSFRVGVTIPPDLQKLFSKRDWQRAMNAAQIDAGRNFIEGPLSLRFTNYAVTHLGYNAKKLDKTQDRATEIRIGRAMMLRDGSHGMMIARFCGGRWGGWDPTAKKSGPPRHVWEAWYKEAIKSGKISPSKTGDWATARRKMRDEMMRETRIIERLNLYSIDEYVDQFKADPVPLVSSGLLFKNHKRNARPNAKAKGGVYELTIPIQREGRVHPQVNKVLSATTEMESVTVAQDVMATMNEFVSRRVIVRGKRGGKQVRMSGRDRSRIALAIRNAKTGAHKNRSTSGQAPRKVA
jgi:hypothetical protein